MTASGSDLDFDALLASVTRFHGYPAPGVLIGAYMVDLAKRALPEGTLFIAISETTWCLPDAIQMLTACTVGNGRLRILDLGLYALSLFDKDDGRGVRVRLDADLLATRPEISAWLFKTKPKREQDSERLRREIRESGAGLYRSEPIRVQASYLEKRSKGAIGRCARCGEAYPLLHGTGCRKCQGRSPYADPSGASLAAGAGCGPCHSPENARHETLPPDPFNGSSIR